MRQASALVNTSLRRQLRAQRLSSVAHTPAPVLRVDGRLGGVPPPPLRALGGLQALKASRRPPAPLLPGSTPRGVRHVTRATAPEDGSQKKVRLARASLGSDGQSGTCLTPSLGPPPDGLRGLGAQISQREFTEKAWEAVVSAPEMARGYQQQVRTLSHE